MCCAIESALAFDQHLGDSLRSWPNFDQTSLVECEVQVDALEGARIGVENGRGFFHDIVKTDVDPVVGRVVNEALETIVDNQDQFRKRVRLRDSPVQGFCPNPGQKSLRGPAGRVRATFAFKNDLVPSARGKPKMTKESEAGDVLRYRWVAAKVRPHR